MDQALNSFRELLNPVPGMEPGGVQRCASERLPERLLHSPMDWWPADATPTGSRTRLLVGIAVWSAYDLRVLDLIEEAIRSGRGQDIFVGVFDVDRLTSPDQLQQLLPRIGNVAHTPVVGLWTAGELKHVLSGFEARQFVAHLYGFDPNAVLERPATNR